ncbi:hypothetical protein GCM10010174_30280 [Kutzneria viridogrisea]|uniref:Uncharacterized protein n=2 Tax=Kutzneria TaxID=43356 RepID=W5VXR0_9PSEU|nr:YbaB/EbfC family nucleoid-associated protein [Kutzneria albida]AHH93628.1 hypothetical protein KALB_251 [Kutzneria albida DSM 43870]MBA8928988.1 DNA-binding protein YbaB [Kutzneria viridogrisea]
MTEPDLSPEQRQAQVAELRRQATGAIEGLRAQMAAVKQAQEQALAATGEATSRDGSVRVVVDATGVVTSLTFSPSAFERSTPDKLSQTVVATIQTAATQARAKAAESLAPVRAGSEEVLAAAGRGTGIDADKLTIPAVPRTAADPGDQADPWRQAQSAPPQQQAPQQQSYPSAPPASRGPASPPPARPVRQDHPDDEDGDGSVLNERPW